MNELSLYFSHHKITFKGKKAEKVTMIKAHIGSLLYNSIERQQPRQPPLRNVQQQVTSLLYEVETDSQGDMVGRVVGSSSSSLSDELILYQNPVWKQYRCQNMDESGHGLRETVMLVRKR